MSNIDSYIQQVDPAAGGHHRTKAFPFAEEGLILVQKTENDFEELKKRIARCKELGVSIPLYIDYKYDGENYWILEELAPGEEFESLVRNGRATEAFANMPYEHIRKYIHDLYLLRTNGIGVETRHRNIFYDRTKGFTTIDVGLLSNPVDSDSLRGVNDFFNLASRTLLPIFPKDEYGQAITTKTILNIMRAYEETLPLFNKYKKWIYRGNPFFAKFIKEHGGDLTMSAEECLEFTTIINELIDRVVEEKIEEPETLFTNKNVSYIEFLGNSIPYCTNFVLFNPEEQELDGYIKAAVHRKIKGRFFENSDDENLRNLYYSIRRNELDPLRIYNPDDIDAQIETEVPPKSGGQK